MASPTPVPPIPENTAHKRSRLLAPVSFTIVLIVIIALVSYFRSSSRNPDSAPVPLAHTIGVGREAALIEKLGLPDLGSANNVLLVEMSPEKRALDESMMSAFKLAGDGKDKARLQQAIAALSEVIKNNPDYADGYVSRATFSLMAQHPDVLAIRSDLDNALKTRSLIKYDNSSSNAAIYSLRARADFLLGDYGQTMNDLESAVMADPDRASNAFNTGSVKPNEGANASALQKEQFDFLILTFPDDYRSYMFRGLFYASFTTYDEQYYVPSLADLNRALDLSPKSALINFLLGEITEKMGFWSQAAAKDVSDITGAKGGYRSKTYQKALHYFDTAVTLDPKFAAAYSNGASELLNLKRYSEAILHYDKAIELEPDNSNDFNDRGLAKSSLGQHFEAIEDFSKAINQKKAHKSGFLENSYEARAEEYETTGNYDRAVDDYSEAIAIKFRDVVFVLGLAQIRSIYPELADISDQDLLEGLRQKYFPAMSEVDFSGQYAKNKQYDDFFLAELYAKRGNAYMSSGKFQKASVEYSRATHTDPSYVIDRWKPVFPGTRIKYSIDIQTLDFSRKENLSLWIRTPKNNGKTFTNTNLQIDCGGRRIKTVSSVSYDAAGNAIPMVQSQNWQPIIPETLGELVYKGMCQ